MGKRTVRMRALAALAAGAWVMGWAQDQGAYPFERSGRAELQDGSGGRPMTFADLQRIKRVSDPQISPSGEWVMYTVTDVDLAKNTKVNHLWVVGVESGNERQVTFGKEGESGGRFSPDGRRVLFTATDSKTGLSQIFLANWNDGAGTLSAPTRLTNVSTEADGGIWSPDSRRILFTSRVYPECSEGSSWIEEDNCDKRRDAEAAASPVKAQIWDHLLYRHWDHYVGLKRSHVLVVLTTDGNAVRDLTPTQDIGDAEAPTFSLDAPVGYAWAPDSQEVAYVTNLDLIPAVSTNNDVFTLRLDETGAKPVKISTSLGSDDGPAYSPDGKYLAFRSQARAGYEGDRFRLMLYDRTGGARPTGTDGGGDPVSDPAEQRAAKHTRPAHQQGDGGLLALMPTFDRWVDEFIWGPDSQTIYLTGADSGEEPIYQLQMAEPAFAQITELGEYGSLSISRDGHKLVATRMKVDAPAEVYLLLPDKPEVMVDETNLAPKRGEVIPPPADGATRTFVSESQLTSMNEALLRTLDLPQMESFWFTGALNAKVQGFIVRPPKFDETQKYPVKFLIHGGPQGAWGDAWSYRWNPQLMAASGYVVVMVNPRGSTGYGQAFIDGVNGDWGGKAYVDLMNGLDYAERHYGFIDKGRECALGASYGGYMADWILTHTNRFACIVTHDGMFNPQSAFGTTEELWFNEWEFRTPGVKGSGQPWNNFDKPAAMDAFRKWSPMLAIKNAKTPTLVIHSQRDYRLDVSEGLQLFTALQLLNVPSKFLYFPDEGHWVLKPQNSRVWYETVGDWCDRWTKSNLYAEGGPESSAKAGAGTRRSAPDTRMGVSRPAEMNEVQPSGNTSAPAAAPSKPAPVIRKKPGTTPEPHSSPEAAPPPSAVSFVSPGTRADVPSSAKADIPSPTGKSGAPFLIAISAPSDEVSMGGDARIVITLRNLEEHEIKFPHRPGADNPEFSYRIVVRNASGKAVDLTPYGREAQQRQGAEGRTVEYVQPGGVVVLTAHLGKLVNLKKPGEYRVKVSRKDPASGLVVESNEIAVDVVP